VEAQDLARAQKKCAAERRLIVFIDESGLSERPTRVSTWAPKGCTPHVQFHFNWKHVSAIAGLTRTNFVFRLLRRRRQERADRGVPEGAAPQLKRRLLIVWDGAAQHKSRIVREYLDSTKGAVQMALLPGYAPDLNPVEYLWAWLKRHALANFCPNTWPSSRPLLAASCKSGQKRSRSSPRAGSKPSFGDVMDYVILNRRCARCGSYRLDAPRSCASHSRTSSPKCADKRAVIEVGSLRERG
jgi:hypothetical protein